MGVGSASHGGNILRNLGTRPVLGCIIKFRLTSILVFFGGGGGGGGAHVECPCPLPHTPMSLKEKNHLNNSNKHMG